MTPTQHPQTAEIEEKAANLYPYPTEHYMSPTRMSKIENRINKQRAAYIKGYTDGVAGWISVEDRLPEQEGRYLCVNVFWLVSEQRWVYTPQVLNFNFYRMRETAELTPRDEQSGCFMDDLAYGKEVTHWQPLPSPPVNQK